MNKVSLSILAGIGGMLGWGTSDFFANISSDKVGHFKVFFWSQLAGLILTLLLIPFFGLNSNITLTFVSLLLVASIFYSWAYLLFYKAFEIGNVSVVSATINLNVIVAMFLAVVFQGQRLTAMQFLAVSLIISGITLVAINFNNLKNKQVELLAGVKETILASILFGVYWNLSEVIAEELGWLPTTLYVKIGAILTLIGFSFLVKQNLSLVKFNLKTKLIIVLVGILEATAVASVNFGLSVGELILVSPISSSLSIVTIAMAVIFLKEKITKTQALGILITLMGIVLTAF